MDAVDETLLNVAYDTADFINEVAFVLACWSTVKSELVRQFHYEYQHDHQQQHQQHLLNNDHFAHQD